MEKYEIFISPLAEKAINDLLDYLINHWSEKAEKAFLKKLYEKFNQIARYPRSCEQSKTFPGLYKCVLSKQTSFYYRINQDEIEVIIVFDNRQNMDYLLNDL